MLRFFQNRLNSFLVPILLWLVLFDVKLNGNVSKTDVEVDSASTAMRFTSYSSLGKEIEIPKQLLSAKSSSVLTNTGSSVQGVVFITGAANTLTKVYSMTVSSNQSSSVSNNTPIAIVKVNQSSLITQTLNRPVNSDELFPDVSVSSKPFTNGSNTNVTAYQIVWNGYYHVTGNTAGAVGIQSVDNNLNINFVDLYGKPITLRGSNESLVLSNLGTAPGNGVTRLWSATWTEEPIVNGSTK